MHAHLVIQFGTKQQLSRKQFVDHFGIDSLHIATKKDKQALMMAYRLPDDQYYVDYENGLYQVLVSDEAASFLKHI